MVPKDVVSAFDRLGEMAESDAARDEPGAVAALQALQMIVIAEGVVGALFSIASSLERIANSKGEGELGALRPPFKIG